MIEFLRRLLNLAKPYWLRLALGIVFGFLGGLVDPLLVLVLPLVGLVVFAGAGADQRHDRLKNLSPKLQAIADTVASWFSAPGNLARRHDENSGDFAGAARVYFARRVQLSECVLPPMGRRPRHHRFAHPAVCPSPKPFRRFFCPVQHRRFDVAHQLGHHGPAKHHHRNTGRRRQRIRSR